MKGLQRLPQIQDLKEAYSALQDPLSLNSADPEKVALYSQWARVDPRLAEILVEALCLKWEAIHPIHLRTALTPHPWPQAVGVLLEFVKKSIPKNKRKTYLAWKSIVLESIPLAPGEQFFIGTRAIAGKEMLLDARFATKEYLNWGYLGRDSLYNKQKYPAQPGPTVRREILRDLLKIHSRITTELYLQALGHSISTRQAERDLLAFPRLRARGKTKGRYFST